MIRRVTNFCPRASPTISFVQSTKYSTSHPRSWSPVSSLKVYKAQTPLLNRHPHYRPLCDAQPNLFLATKPAALGGRASTSPCRSWIVSSRLFILLNLGPPHDGKLQNETFRPLVAATPMQVLPLQAQPEATEACKTHQLEEHDQSDTLISHESNVFSADPS